MNSKLIFFFLFLATAAALNAESKLKPIFSGKDLAGWQVPKGNDEAGWYSAVDGVLKIKNGPNKKAVSYTHLTLPTIYSV